MSRPWLTGFLMFLFLSLSACDGGEEQDGGNNGEENPCGDACPIEECSFGQCIGGNNGDTPDMGGDDAQDAHEDMEDASPELDAEDLPDADDADDVEDMEVEPDATEDADIGEDEPDASEDEPDMVDPPDMEVEEGCDRDEDCIAGQICDQEQEPPTCRLGCRRDEDCLDGQICDRESLSCAIGCRNNDDCGDGEACNRDLQECVPGDCGSDQDCPVDRYCDLEAESSVCLPGCRVGDCPQGQYCRLDDRQCADGCATDAQCETAQYCELSLNDCVEGCRDDAGCELGQTCQRLGVEGQPGLTRQQCAVPTCTNDATCPEGFFCEPPGEEPGERFCLQGCRLAPDDCPQDSFCDPQSRQCRPEGCLTDEDCPDPAQFCDANTGACMDGCRDIDGACGVLGEVCDLQARACTCALGQCASGTVCGNDALCLPSCVGQEGACADGTACDTESGLCVPSCASDLDCDMAQFCDMDLAPPQCAQGCRLGGCPEGQGCNPLSRLCEDGCQDDSECAPDSYCDGGSGLCFVGCRVEPDNCAQGSACQAVDTEQGPRQRCVDLGLCDFNEDCADEAFCGESEELEGARICQVGCRVEPDNCPEGFSCDPGLRSCGVACEGAQDCEGSQQCIEGRCVLPGPCQADADCAAGTFCDVELTQPICRPGCRAGFGDLCPNPQRCDTVTRACTLACQNDLDCQEGYRCDEPSSLCLPLCEDDGACQEGSLCLPRQERQVCLPSPTCINDLDCPEETFCDQEEQRCLRGCTLEAESCPEGEACHPETRQCGALICERQAECPQGLICSPFTPDESRCSNLVTGCEDDFGCPLGLICQQEFARCQLPCQEDADCGAGRVCDLNSRQCLSHCEEDADCPEGQLCLFNGEGQSCQEPRLCESDRDCPQEEWCVPAEQVESNQALCQPGCRATPDNCGDGQSCDPLSRQCQERPCALHSDCPEGMACIDTDGEGVCRVGCRDNEACPEGEFCLPGQGLCSCDLTACAPGQVCGDLNTCAWGCQEDSDCPGDTRCDSFLGQCQALCESDLFCESQGQSLLCDPDRALCLAPGCAQDADCPLDFYCEGRQGQQRCVPGCAPGRCPQGQRCEQETRLCVELCTSSQSCGQGEICLAGEGLCVPGCAGQEECAPGQICAPVESTEGPAGLCMELENPCAQDADCPEAQYCAQDVGACLEGCRLEPDNCGAVASCDEVDRVCLVDPCAGDEECSTGYICEPVGQEPQCIAGCRADEGCPRGCDQDLSQCLCEQSQDCPQGQACAQGACVAGCQSDQQCPEGLSCLSEGYCALVCNEDSLEPNNSPEAAASVAPGTYVNLQMCNLEGAPQENLDCYAVELEAFAFMEVRLQSELELRLAIYDSQGQEQTFSNSPGGFEILPFSPPEAGTWVICVEPDQFPSSGSYDLNLQLF